MPLPNIYVKVGLALAFICAIFAAGFYVEHLRFVKYEIEVESAAKAQEAHNKAVEQQHQLVTKSIQDEYEAKLSAIKSYYGGLHYSSSSKLSIVTNSPSRVDESTANQLLACATTTQQLVSLQKWINEQVGIK
jgi:D-ribose pyranose/furanose isomerase RbsD